MTHTISENIVTEINSNVFFKEFTFDKNDFYPKDGKKELADNVMWLDNLLFIIQVKERNIKEATLSVDDWFVNKVLKKAKIQICKTIEYLNKYDEIPIENCQKQILDISKVNLNGINKIIIYKSEEKLNDRNKNLKIYESKLSGNIHIFNIIDYYWICKYLITPSELDEYLKFRARIYLKHKEIITIYPEQYILGHFLNTDDESEINEEYIETINKFEIDFDRFDISHIIENFLDRIRVPEQKESTGYHYIISEIAKLKREELFEFKSRFYKAFEEIKGDSLSLPYRFVATRTGCGFVFIPLPKENIKSWENVLKNSTEIFKYKHKLLKCLGVVMFKEKDYIDINWTFFNHPWEFDRELEKLVSSESDMYGKGTPFIPRRYND